MNSQTKSWISVQGSVPFSEHCVSPQASMGLPRQSGGKKNQTNMKIPFESLSLTRSLIDLCDGWVKKMPSKILVLPTSSLAQETSQAIRLASFLREFLMQAMHHARRPDVSVRSSAHIFNESTLLERPSSKTVDAPLVCGNSMLIAQEKSNKSSNC